MSNRHQELQQLHGQITDHDTNITQMEELLQRTPSEGLRTALQAEVARRDAARARLLKLEEIIALEGDINRYQQTVGQYEQTAQQLRDEREAVQRRLTQAETELNRARIELSSKQSELRQKETELEQVGSVAAAPGTPRPGGTVRLSMAPPAALRIVSTGNHEQISNGKAIIGREKMTGVDIAMNEETVSSTHARIAYEDNQWSITDLGSANGTWVDNQQIPPQAPTPISHGSGIRFGRVVTTFELLNQE
jgi:hypothetical protein